MSHLYIRPDAKVPNQTCFVDTEEKLSEVCNEILQLAEHNEKEFKKANKQSSSSDEDKDSGNDESDEEKEDNQSENAKTSESAKSLSLSSSQKGQQTNYATHAVVALDLEGKDLGRDGVVCVITLATPECVYLIDMVTLNKSVLNENAPLRQVLESDKICKVMFDCRSDCDALYFIYGVRLRNVCDLQIASCLCLFPLQNYLPGMKVVFQKLNLFTEWDKKIKLEGRDFFEPRLGGSYDNWAKRPLPELLREYCIVDVKYFFVAQSKFWSYLQRAMPLSEARLSKVVSGNFSVHSSLNSHRDFATEVEKLNWFLKKHFYSYFHK